MKKKSLRLFRKLHKWPGIVIAMLAILFALSGLVMNHRQLFSSIDVDRDLLPPGYQYKNWNMAAVRGALITADQSEYFYGNIGVWQKKGTQFVNFNQGFPSGIDHRKITQMAEMPSGKLFAATLFGLYCRLPQDTIWKKIQLPLREERLTGVFLKQDSLIVLSRSFLLKSANGNDFECIQLAAPEGYQARASLFTTLWQLHSGELFGLPGKLFVDLLGLATILLSLSGLLHFFLPKLSKHRKAKQKSTKRLTTSRRINLRWHNVIGYSFILFLIINTTAGMFLRPPLLIPIASSTVPLIPGTQLDNPNPWFEKLRAGVWDETLQQYLISTSDGFYFLDENLNAQPQSAHAQPPVSVMGCNVLQKTEPARYLVGSFSGLFVWDIQQQLVVDAFTGMAPQHTSGRPVSDHMISGYATTATGEHILFDYNEGMRIFEHSENPDMPVEIIRQSPLSLWNTALEVHTGRIFEHMLGPFYILYVPLSGICLLMVLVSGFLIWWKAYRKTKKQA